MNGRGNHDEGKSGEGNCSLRDRRMLQSAALALRGKVKAAEFT